MDFLEERMMRWAVKGTTFLVTGVGIVSGVGGGGGVDGWWGDCKSEVGNTVAIKAGIVVLAEVAAVVGSMGRVDGCLIALP